MEFDLNEIYESGFPYGEDWNTENIDPNYGDEEGGNGECHMDEVEENCDGFVESPPQAEEDEENLAGSFEKRLSPGQFIESLEQAYKLYCEYGRLKGFSVRKGRQKYTGASKEIRRKEFFCSCRGMSNAKQSTDRLHQYRKQDFRTNCDAMLCVLLQVNGRWLVKKFTKAHNHDLCDRGSSHLLRSSRAMSYSKQSLMESLHSAGIRVADAYRFMEKEAGGSGCVGFSKKDAYNHVYQAKKKSKFGHSDSNLLVKHFMQLSNSEHDFYWNMQTDDEGRVLNIFFRDSRSAVDYELFGDVLSFDTTYKTNKFDLVCAPFVGVNHHLKNCMFGMAFLSDETTETFEWLFSTFLDSMNGKQPDVVFSDQSQALMNGIDSIFTSSTHRLCQWHINQNAPSHFGSLNGNAEFKKLWFLCMNGCESVEDFETTWRTMIDDYNLVGNRWFQTMYNIRARWASVFSRSRFCAGLHATSRSEVTNKVLKDVSSSSGSLYEFILKYEQIQVDWREIEKVDDTACLGVPGLLVSHNPMLKQAGKYLTRRVFLSYEYEATHSLNVDILSEHACGDSGSLVEFVIKDCVRSGMTRRVTYNRLTTEASCTCCLWETVGVLCAHVFKVLFSHNVKVIPPVYLLRRLSKEAKKRRSDDILRELESSSREDNPLEDAAFKSHVMRSTYGLIHDLKMDLNMRAHLLKGLDTLRDELVSMRKDGDMPGRRQPFQNFVNAEEVPSCRDPPISQNRRFTTTRLSRHWEKPRRKRKKPSGEVAGSVMRYPFRPSNTQEGTTSGEQPQFFGTQ